MLMSLIAVMMASPVSAQALKREDEVVAACENWWRDLDVNDEAKAHAVAGGGLCLNGFIDPGSDVPILTLIAASPPKSDLIFVVRSGGGDFDASMNVAEALQSRHPTVIAETLCASSCADYIIVAGARRIVRDDTFLAYHGGVTMNLLDQARPKIEALAKADSTIDVAAGVEQIRLMLESQLTRQTAFMQRAGVRPEIFTWMDEANGPEGESHTAQCPPESTIIQYSEPSLARFGLTFDYYGAPQSQADVDALVEKRGRSSKICYWRD